MAIDNDRNKSFYKRGGCKVVSPEEAVKMDYDVIIVATAYSKEIYEQAVRLGFDLSKFIFIFNNYFYTDMNNNYELAEKVFANNYIEIVKNRYHVIRGMMKDEMIQSPFAGEEYRNCGMYLNDYNRIRTLELVGEEIKANQVKGAVAELGVFRGEFAKYINAAFNEKTIYLFDTFEGFREEAIIEKNRGNCGTTFIERFKETSEGKILQIMPYPENVVCKKGLFPESLEGLEDTFAFVSLDVDFEKAIYDGIDYFYPRLNEGGYMFIHDYNSSSLFGVKKAVEAYEKNNKVRLMKVPIPDLDGTVVIVK